MKLHQFAQKAFICKNGFVLVAHKTASDRHNPDRWEMPGGRMLFGEDVDAHIKREVFEETGLQIVPGEPFFIWQWIMSDPSRPDSDEIQVVAVARECTTYGGTITLANQEHDDYIGEARWVPVSELLELNLIPSLRPAAEAFVVRQLSALSA